MNTELAEKFDRLQETIKTHGVQYFAGDDAEETNTFIENLGKEGNHQTVKKNRIGRFVFDPNKTLIVCSCRGKTPEDWENKTKTERQGITRVRSARIAILRNHENNDLAGVKNIVFVGYSKTAIARFAEKNPNKNCWFFGIKGDAIDFLVPKVNASDRKMTIGVDVYKVMEKQWIKTTEKDISTLHLMDTKYCFHDTQHSELNILPFLGEVPEVYIDVGTDESPGMDCDIHQVVVAQPAALEATPERIVDDKLPSFSDHLTHEDWLDVVAVLCKDEPVSAEVVTGINFENFQHPTSARWESFDSNTEVSGITTPELTNDYKLSSSSGYINNEATSQGVQDPNPRSPKIQRRV